LTHFPTFYVAFLAVIFIEWPVHGQSDPFRALEDSVYRFNNALKFKESQALLLPVLQSDRLSPDYKYQAAILLSYTYKRVQDYESRCSFWKKPGDGPARLPTLNRI